MSGSELTPPYCSDRDDFPEGYKERVDVLIGQIMPLAGDLMAIGEEFMGDNIELNGGGICVKISHQNNQKGNDNE